MWLRASVPAQGREERLGSLKTKKLIRSSQSDLSPSPSSAWSSDDGRYGEEGRTKSHVSLTSSDTGQSFTSSPPLTPDETGSTMTAGDEDNHAYNDDKGHQLYEEEDSVANSTFVLALEELPIASNEAEVETESDALLDLNTIGLGLTSRQPSLFNGSRRHRIVGSASHEGAISAGPFAHHRSPSWVVQAHVSSAQVHHNASRRPKASHEMHRSSTDAGVSSDSLHTQAVNVSNMKQLVTPSKATSPKNRSSSLAGSPTSQAASLTGEAASSDSSDSARKVYDSAVGIVPKPRTSSLATMNSILSYRDQDQLSTTDGHSTDTASCARARFSRTYSTTLPTAAGASFVFSSSSSSLKDHGSHDVMSKSSEHASTGLKSEKRFGRPRLPRRFTDSRISFRSSTASSTQSDSMDTQRLQQRSRDVLSSSRPSSSAGNIHLNLSTTAMDSMIEGNAETILGLDDVFWNGGDFVLGAEESGTNNGSAGLAVSFAEDGRGVCVEANGRRTREIQEDITAGTTHIVLAGCSDPEMFAFLERILPLVSQSLLVLDLSCTGLHELPNGLRQCSRLEELNLSHNAALQSSTANLDVLSDLCFSLRLLIVDHCELTMLPGSLMHLRQLRMLSACGNHLTHLPAWLHRLKRLERLLLSDNSFQGPWQTICQAFTSPDQHQSQPVCNSSNKSSFAASSLSLIDLNAEPSARLSGFWNASQEYDVVEELDEAPPSSHERELGNEQVGVANVQQQKSLFRPFVRRMLSAGDLKGAHEASQKSATIEAESKWGAIKRRMIRKGSNPEGSKGAALSVASTPPLMVATGSATLDTIAHTSPSASAPLIASLTTNASLTSLPNLTIGSPAEDDCTKRRKKSLPTSAFHKHAQEARKRTKRMSFLPFGIPLLGANGPEAYSEQQDNGAKTISDGQMIEQARHMRNVRLLLQYLEDLSDLNPVQRDIRLYMDRPSISESCVSLASTRNRTTRSESTPASSSSSSLHNDEVDGFAPPTTLLDLDLLSTASKLRSPTSPTVPYKDDANRRLHIIREIIATEKSYIKMLKELVDIYVNPSAHIDPISQLPGIPLHERRQVFGNVGNILYFHSEAFLPALESAARSAFEYVKVDEEHVNDIDVKDDQKFHEATIRAAEKVAQTFERHAAFFRMYTSYVNNVDAAQQRISIWHLAQTASPVSVRNGSSLMILRRDSHISSSNSSVDPTLNNGGNPIVNAGATGVTNETMAGFMTAKERKRLRVFLQRARMDPRHSQISLEAYIHLPVQRIPRYRLLLADLVRTCPPARLSDPLLITNALSSIASIATMINESKRQSEMDRRLLQWQERIRGTFPSPLVQPHRKLIHDGVLTLRRIVSRVPSFTVSESAVLGDFRIESDSYEESTLLSIADTTRCKDRPCTSEGDKASILNSSTGDTTALQVHHLERQNVHRQVHVILCNDITVIVEGPPAGGPVELFAVLRVTGPARIVNERTLRISDVKHILYLDASSKREAEDWRRALSSAYLSSSASISSPTRA